MGDTDGAHCAIDHTKPLAEQVNRLHVPPVKYIASLTATARNFAQLVEVLAPEGKLGLIDDPETLDLVPLKRKAASLHWESCLRARCGKRRTLPSRDYR
jgi:hypothetical protein